MSTFATPAPELARTGHLTKQNFADFKNRLWESCEGSGVAAHCTANALFLVQRRVTTWGLTEGYAQHWGVVASGKAYDSIAQFYESCDEERRRLLDSSARNLHGKAFIDLDHESAADLLERREVEVVGYRYSWSFVSAHFTPEAAQLFIDKNKFGFDEPLRVYVFSQAYCEEFNAVKNALMDGRISFN
ncbi:hypothetical protein [Comamonas sp. HJ-2]